MKLTKYLRKDIRDDILNLNKLKNFIKKYQPEFIFHLAAQSSVLVSYNTPKETIGTNVIGTINILEAIRNNKSVKSFKPSRSI